MTPVERLIAAAKWTIRVRQAQIRGEHLTPQEDIFSGRELVAAVEAVEEERRATELVDRR